MLSCACVHSYIYAYYAVNLYVTLWISLFYWHPSERKNQSIVHPRPGYTKSARITNISSLCIFSCRTDSKPIHHFPWSDRKMHRAPGKFEYVQMWKYIRKNIYLYINLYIYIYVCIYIYIYIYINMDNIYVNTYICIYVYIYV